MSKVKFYSFLDWGAHRFMEQHGYEQVRLPEEADIIVLNGGEDIATEIYNEIPVFRGVPHHKSNRDKQEIALFNEFRGSKFMLGICRGAQLLNCLNGGTLWQHVNNHGRNHRMIDLETGEIIDVTSTHHQMMRPNLTDGKIIGLSSEATVKHAEGVLKNFDPVGDLRNGTDIEIVWYPDTKALCIQGHPEYYPSSRFSAYCVGLINKLGEFAPAEPVTA